LIVSCTVLKAIWQKSSFGWRLVGLGLIFRFGSVFFGMAPLWQDGGLSQEPENSNCTTTSR
jgi:hypothetical protein